MLNLARESGYEGIVAGTRKTTPGQSSIDLDDFGKERVS
jgi:hypothetical protein